ncbi:ubiquinol-cytochrome-c reductase complex assembly factor 2-like [Anneissia japonica]|uniref:ubiquinol-cytochrome-c reductase complex assembly factor 2-like n=1 Tax=Anneissia japonica TaxID=1529436 RepID=UPI00142571A9|nr:ubiquinol-cytochrome-c reductase complex assembly factor 2-like [Anneissia japonica]
MAVRYRSFLRLCQNWPLDPTKEGRDIAVHIRRKVAEGFRHGENTKVDEVECQRVYTALEKLSTNYYKNKYPTVKNVTGALGVDVEDCKLAMSTDSIRELDEMTKSYWSKMKEFATKEDKMKRQCPGS